MKQSVDLLNATNAVVPGLHLHIQTVTGLRETRETI